MKGDALDATIKSLNKSAKDEKSEDNRKEFAIQKYTNERLAEAILMNDLPYFLQIDEQGKPILKDAIETPAMILKPIDKISYRNKPYEFKHIDEIKYYIDRARQKTLADLYRDAQQIWRKYIDAPDHNINICAADTVFTYFQDKLGMTHYLLIVGDNGTGKSNYLVVFQHVGYRPLFDTSVTPANIYTYLGSVEQGQGIILEDEADNIDKSDEKMRICKVGYKSGTKVSRIDTSSGRNQYSYWTYCFKAMTAERQPDAAIAKGFNERTFVIHTKAGLPAYDIAEVVNHGEHPTYKALMAEMEDFRKVMLMYRMLHYKDIIPDVALSIRNREKQLCKPLVRLFRNSGAVLDEILSTLAFFLDEKRERKSNTLEARLFSIVRGLTASGEYTLKNADIWTKVTEMDGNPVQGKPQSFESAEFGVISQKRVMELLKDKFGAKNSFMHEETGDKRTTQRALTFSKATLDSLQYLYSEATEIKIVDPSESGTDGTHGTLLGHVEQLAEAENSDKTTEN